MSTSATTWSTDTAAPSSSSAPAAGSVTSVTLARASPESVSSKLKSAAAKVYAVSSSVVTVLSALVGALLAALTTMSNSSLTVAPSPSLAVTFTVTVPTSPPCGVPENVRVVSSKVSQGGSALSSSFVAM